MSRSLKYVFLAAAVGLGATAVPAMGQTPGTAAPVTYEQPLTDRQSSSLADRQQLHTAGNALADRSRSKPLPLRQPGKTSEASADPSQGRGSLFTVFGSLSVVLALFFAVAWLMKRGLPQQGGQLPQASFEVIGRASLAPRQDVHLVRLGSKLLLVAVSPNAAHTLAEVHDAAEIEQLLQQCRSSGGQTPRDSNRRRWPFSGTHVYRHDNSSGVAEHRESNTTHREAHHV